MNKTQTRNPRPGIIGGAFFRREGRTFKPDQDGDYILTDATGEAVGRNGQPYIVEPGAEEIPVKYLSVGWVATDEQPREARYTMAPADAFRQVEAHERNTQGEFGRTAQRVRVWGGNEYLPDPSGDLLAVAFDPIHKRFTNERGQECHVSHAAQLRPVGPEFVPRRQRHPFPPRQLYQATGSAITITSYDQAERIGRGWFVVDINEVKPGRQEPLKPRP